MKTMISPRANLRFPIRYQLSTASEQVPRLLFRELIILLLLVGSQAAAFAQPIIVTPPQWQTNAIGSTAIFSVVATGAPPIFYQWRFNGFDRAGATNETLLLTNVQTANQGNYTIVVTNQAGATSAVARLYVVTLPV